MDKIKKQDFIEIEYTGKVKGEDIIFDTTDEKIAKENELPKKSFGPIVVCLGKGQVLEGLDSKLIGKEIGKEYDISLSAEEAFGKKSAQLIQLVPTNKFKQNNVMPQPGLQVDIDGMNGIIKHVSGGRTLVDFNHPLSGKEIEYKVKINKIIEDDAEKLNSFIKLTLGTDDIKTDLKEGKASVSLKADIPKEIAKEFEKQVKEVIPSIKEMGFKKEEPKKENTEKNVESENKEEVKKDPTPKE